MVLRLARGPVNISFLFFLFLFPILSKLFLYLGGKSQMKNKIEQNKKNHKFRSSPLREHLAFALLVKIWHGYFVWYLSLALEQKINLMAGLKNHIVSKCARDGRAGGWPRLMGSTKNC
ncbi:hypothetical protein BDV30DRAFT_215970 [Aspergillus minisclerotigenes]|uniref:Uncharacterized protein n=1 Tax=Aspergillus minisclerotigenes TaxID=656917 RepID=A0A5N6IUI4_9EURO|nr:hypothetical protein BDV30DRAFT_215970 [Aspergillus minisclerotigenes]